MKSSIVGSEGGGPRLKLFKFVPPPPGLLLLLLLLSLKLVLPIPLSLSNLFCVFVSQILFPVGYVETL